MKKKLIKIVVVLALSCVLFTSLVLTGNAYDFIGENRLFNTVLTPIAYSSPPVENYYSFLFKIWRGANCLGMMIRSTGTQVDLIYRVVTDDGSEDLVVYTQTTNSSGDIVGTWVVPSARMIQISMNPSDTNFQNFILNNSIAYDPEDVEFAYNTGYDFGFQKGVANSLVGDSLKGPINALSEVTLININGTDITLGGVVMTAIALSLLLAFLKMYAGG